MEGREGFFQVLAAARVVLGERGGGEARVGDVAAAAAGDFDLGEELGGLLKQDHLRRGMVTGRRERREEPRRAAADHRHLQLPVHPRKLAHKAGVRVS